MGGGLGSFVWWWLIYYTWKASCYFGFGGLLARFSCSCSVWFHFKFPHSDPPWHLYHDRCSAPQVPSIFQNSLKHRSVLVSPNHIIWFPGCPGPGCPPGGCERAPPLSLTCSCHGRFCPSCRESNFHVLPPSCLFVCF